MNRLNRGPSSDPVPALPWAILLVGWFLTAFYLSSLSSIQVPGVPIRAALGLPHVDKAFHFVFYTLLGIIVAGVFQAFVAKWWLKALPFIIPILDETWQAFHRHPTLEDVGDLAVDFIGILLGMYGWNFLTKRAAEREKAPLQITILALMLIAALLCFVVGYTWAWDVSGDKMLHVIHK